MFGAALVLGAWGLELSRRRLAGGPGTNGAKKRCSLLQARRRSVVTLELENHPANVAIALVRLQGSQARVRVAPLQNLDVLFPRSPGIHRAARGHIKIDRVPAGQRPAVIVHPINLSGRNQTEDRARRPARPICRGASDLRLVRDHNFLCAVLRLHHLRRFAFLQRKLFERRTGIRSAPVIRDVVTRVHRNRPRRVFGMADCASRGVKFAAERIVISVRKMVGLGVRVSRRAHVLEIALRQRRLIFRKRTDMGTSRRSLARAQAEGAKRGAEKKEMAPVTQSRWLLTIIHNHMQEYFFTNLSRLTTRWLEGPISFVNG